MIGEKCSVRLFYIEIKWKGEIIKCYFTELCPYVLPESALKQRDTVFWAGLDSELITVPRKLLNK